MDTNLQLNKKISIGISFYRMSAEEWIKIFNQFHPYICDIFFSPVEKIEYQTRRKVYDYDTQDIPFLENELTKVLDAAKDFGISRKIVLNVPSFINDCNELVPLYEKYKNKYNVELVTTFLSCAKRIKEIAPEQSITCSYNQGIKSREELEYLLTTDVFDTIVLGTNFFRDIDSYKLIHKYEKKVELLLNNGCMRNCKSFCRYPNVYCSNNFEINLLDKDLNKLYAECSMFPEEVHKYLIPLGLIDFYKLSTRPIFYKQMVDMLSSYIQGNSSMYISSNYKNYNLYGRLAHFHPYYSELNYDSIIKYKENIWEESMKSYEI